MNFTFTTITPPVHAADLASVGSTDLYYGPVSGYALYKSNGTTETLVKSPTPVRMDYFCTTSDGATQYIYGYNGLSGTYAQTHDLYKSTDYGTTWSLVAPSFPFSGGASEQIRGLAATGNNLYLVTIVSSHQNINFHTFNGTSWHWDNNPSFTSYDLSVYVINSTGTQRYVVYFDGIGNKIIHSTDGIAWSSIPSPSFAWSGAIAHGDELYLTAIVGSGPTAITNLYYYNPNTTSYTLVQQLGTTGDQLTTLRGNSVKLYASGIDASSAALWKRASLGPTYTVSYDGNTSTSGSQTDGSSPYDAGSNVTALSAGSLVKTGGTFAGWNTAANGSGTSYAVSAIISNIQANITLYAQWTLTSPVTIDGSNSAVTGTKTWGDGSSVTLTTSGVVQAGGVLTLDIPNLNALAGVGHHIEVKPGGSVTLGSKTVTSVDGQPYKVNGH